MSHKNTLMAILVISIAGLMFSGYLSYYELFAENGCSDAVISCGTKKVEIADLPACVYGFAMYAVIFLLTLTSLLRHRK